MKKIENGWLHSTLGLVVITIYLLAGIAKAADLMLWYTAPATVSSPETSGTGLLLGNGRLGGVVPGNVTNESIFLNEDSLWSGNTNVTGNYAEGPTGAFGSYQLFGNLLLNLPSQSGYTGYQRTLDLNTGVATVTYTNGGVAFTRTMFCSNPDQVLVMQLTANAAASYTGSLQLSDGHSTATISTAGGLMFSGALANGEMYEAQLLVANSGGTLVNSGGVINFTNCNSLLLVVALGTSYSTNYLNNFAGSNPHTTVVAQAQAAAAESFATLETSHTNDFSALFNRVSIYLGPAPAGRANLPTDQRLTANIPNDDDPGMDQLMFAYGRYMMISASRGALPMNLQGLWNDNNNPNWSSDYHTDLNVQMMYSGEEVANLPECFLPFVNYLQSQIPVWRYFTTNAGTGLNNGSYGYGFGGTNGWATRASENVWGGQGWEWVEGANAWYCMYVWDHYQFTGNTNYLLNEAYPMMKEVCQYWQQHLQALPYATNGEPAGTLMVTNGWSPETGPRENGVTCDQEFIWDVFNNYQQAAGILNTDAVYSATVSNLQANLLLPRIGPWGELREWFYTADVQGPNPGTSEMEFCGLYPGRQITPEVSPSLAAAARVHLLSLGADGGYEWAYAQHLARFARLHDWWSAHQALALQYNDTLPNLSGYNQVAQMDSCIGVTAGIAETLLQSQSGFINLLPALPNAWPAGSVSGLRARGGYTVGITWTNSAAAATLTPDFTGTCTVNTPNPVTVANNGVPVTVTNTASGYAQWPAVAGNTYTLQWVLPPFPAQMPAPANCAAGVNPSGAVLAWIPGGTNYQHNLYFGASFNGVATATTNSPQFQGLVSGATNFSLPLLQTNTTYFWRVDEISGANIGTGAVWQFTTLASTNPISFGAPVDIMGDADVSTNGTLACAFCFNAAETINGVPFTLSVNTPPSLLGTLSTAPNIFFLTTVTGSRNPSAFSSSSAPYSGLSVAYKAVLQASEYASSQTGPQTVILTNLTVGHTYLVQFWVSDPRGSPEDTRTDTLTSSDGNSVTLDFSYAQAAGYPGQYTIGRFTAITTTQSFTVTADATGASPQMNAIQLRDLGLASVAATPIISPAAGTYYTPLTVTIAGESGGTVFYTTDGSTPTNSSPNGGMGTGSASVVLSVPGTVTVNAFETNSAQTNSAMASATYVLLPTASAIWTNFAGGSWATAANWSSDVVPGGMGSTADFSQMSLSGPTTVTLDGAGPIGTMIFNDQSGNNYNWTLNPGSGGPLTLLVGSGSPVISNNTPVMIGAVLAGTQGLTKNGGNTLTLTNNNTYTGVTTINTGTLQIGAGGAGGALATSGITNHGTLVLDVSTMNSLSVPVTGTGTLTANVGSGTVGILAPVSLGSISISSTSASVLGQYGSTYSAAINLFTNVTTTGNQTYNGVVSIGRGSSASFGTTLTTTGGGSVNLLGGVVSGLPDYWSSGVLTIDTSAGNGNVTLGGTNLAYGVGNLNINSGTGTITLTGGNYYYDFSVFNGNVALTGNSIFQPANQWVRGVAFNGNVTGAYTLTASLGNGAALTTGTGVPGLIFSNATTQTVSCAIAGTSGLVKSGAGTLSLTGANTYTGATAINAGQMLVNGSLGSGSAVTVLAGATLGGAGTIGGTVTDTGTLAPGNSGVGTLNTGAETWNGGGSYACEINSTNSTGCDLLNITGVLNVLATNGSPFTVKLVSLTSSNTPGRLPGFNKFANCIWTIATASGGLSNFATNDFLVDTSLFANDFSGGYFGLVVSGGSLRLNYSAAPLVVPQFTAVGAPNGLMVRISGDGGAGQNYILLGSTNLGPATWVPIATNLAATNGLFQFADPQAPNYPSRFYRITTP